MHPIYRLPGLLLALALLGTAALGQGNPSLVPGSSGTAPGALAQLAEGTAGRDEMYVSDVFFGRNAKGPYLLSWNEVVSGSETVLLGGVRLSRDRDYMLDYKTGSLTFSQMIRNGSLCRVRYAYNAAVSRPNQASLSIPVTFDLLHNRASEYKLSLNYQQKNARGSDPGTLVAMLGGKSRLSSGTEVTSAFFVTPKAEGETSSGDRTALRLGTDTQGKNYRFITSFAQAGDSFRAAKEQGFQAGRQVVDMALSYQPTETLAFQSSVNRIADIEGAEKGQTALVTTQNVVMSFQKAPTVTATHQTTDADSPDGTGKRKIADRLQLDQRFGQSTSATLVGESVSTSEGGQSLRETSTGLNVASQLNPNMGIQGSYLYKDTPVGAENTGSVAVEASPANRVKVQSRFTHKTGPASSQTTTDLRVATALKQGLTVEGNYLRDDATQAISETRKLGVAVSTDPKWKLSAAVGEQEKPEAELFTKEAELQARPIPLLDFSGGYKVREDMRGVAHPIESYQTAIGLTPDRHLRIAARIARNPEDARGNIAFARSHGMDLQSDWGGWQLTGGFSRNFETASDRLTRIVQAGLGVSLFGPGKLFTEYKWSRMKDQSDWDAFTYSLGYTYQFGDFSLSLSGSLTRYEQDGTLLSDKTDKKAEARLGVRF